MAKWPKDELGRIAEADDLHIAPLRDDGAALTGRSRGGHAYRAKYRDSPYLSR